MSRGGWHFDSLITENTLTLRKLMAGGIRLNEIEVNILWHLGKSRWRVEKKSRKVKEKKQLILYDLKKAKFIMPESVGSIHVVYKDLEKMTKEGTTYFYPEGLKAVNLLVQKGLAETKHTLIGKRKTKEVSLTSLGAIIYLRESKDKNRFKNIRNNYPDFLPFFNAWELLCDKLGTNQVASSLEKAMDRCRFLLEATFKIKRLNFEFKGYIEKNWEEIMITKQVPLERNKESINFLSSEEGKILRNSYIAFLAVHDILLLSKKSNAEVKKIIPTLKSEMELAFFENRDIDSNPLFKSERLKEFFPRYAGMEYFITGMFAEELLWKKKEVESVEDFEYEVQF